MPFREKDDAILNPAWALSLESVFTDAELNAIHSCKILLIDDEPRNVRLFECVLANTGFKNVVSTTDSRQAASLFTDFEPDLVITDWLMPEVDGDAVIEQIRALTSTDDYLPIIVLTADASSEVRMRALAVGATDFLTKPFDRIEAVLRIQNLLKARLSHLTIQSQNATLEASVRLRTIELEEALTELRSTQKQIIQQERLAALGAMAGGIAHDFNNSLSIITGFGELLLRDAQRTMTDADALLPITTILTAAKDAAQIVHRLRAFHHPDEAVDQRIPLDLNKLIEEAVVLTRPRWQTEATADGRAIAVTVTPNPVPFIAGDPSELREVLTNLIFNAVDALPRGGLINLATHRDGEFVALTVSDDGTGMSEKVRLCCLEPFFTTKGQQGTGLGLSMVFGIIQRHAGFLEIESKPGLGTTFTLRLPVMAAESVAGPDSPPWSNTPLRILVVDDQPILGRLVCEHLQDDFHSVEVALSGSEALEKFRAKGFDLVITDHVMAGMTGEELAGAIKGIAAMTPVILLTGYGGKAEPENRYSASIDVVLAKPISRAALRQALGKAMTAGAESRKA